MPDEIGIANNLRRFMGFMKISRPFEGRFAHLDALSVDESI